jgi:two-component system, cell cycle sensor histidine kinase and response regulator CckA
MVPAVAWPAALAPGPTLPAARSRQNPPRRRLVRLVYVVDDELALTELYRLALEPAGYKIKTFQNRAEALVALLAEEPQPDLLITDYEGYPITAEAFIHACRRARPDLKILIATGYPPGFLGPLTRNADGFLQKPFPL